MFFEWSIIANEEIYINSRLLNLYELGIDHYLKPSASRVLSLVIRVYDLLFLANALQNIVLHIREDNLRGLFTTLFIANLVHTDASGVSMFSFASYHASHDGKNG